MQAIEGVNLPLETQKAIDEVADSRRSNVRAEVTRILWQIELQRDNINCHQSQIEQCKELIAANLARIDKLKGGDWAGFETPAS